VNELKHPRIRLCRHRFELTGLNLERFINIMQKNGIPLLRVRRLDHRTLRCECHSCDLDAIAAVADGKGWRMSEVHPLALSALLKGMKKRPGIPAGLLLALAVSLILSQFVWRIEIHNAGAYHADIVSYLTETGFRAGMRKQNADAKALEQALLYRYPEISWFHVYVSNVTLVVDVTHGTPMPALPEQEQMDVTAACDGIIASIQVFAGTAAVEPGDAVRRGQILIRGEERGSDGQMVPVHAAGVVMARCWMTRTVRMSLYEIQSTETGREICQTRIRTPWFLLPLQGEEPQYLACNTYLEEIPLGGVFLPVLHQRLIHREVAMEYVKRDLEEVRKEAADAACEQLRNALYGYEIIDKWVDYCMIEDESLSASATAEWLMDIGGSSPP